MKEAITYFINEHRSLTILIAGLFGLVVTIGMFIADAEKKQRTNVFNVSLIIIGIAVLHGLWSFYSSEKRMEHQFNAFHGTSFLSGFYRIFFPVIILAILIQFIVTLALVPTSLGGWGVLDPSVSPSGNIVLIVGGILTGIGLIVLSDFEMRKRGILFAPRGKKSGYFRSLLYVIPLLGVYFGARFFVQFFLTRIYGEGALVPISQDFFQIDGGIVAASRFWIFLTDREKLMTLIAFIALYIGAEFLLRGLIANEARSYGLGAGGIVFVPAIIQAFALTSGTFLFTDTVYYFFILFDAFLLGSVIGITLWRTGKMSTTISIALLARLLDNGSDFQVTVLQMLPTGLGEYNPLDSFQSDADKIGFLLIFIEVVLVIVAPFIIIVSYQETFKIVKQLWDSLKNQWFGYLVLGLAFFIVDIVFTFIAARNPFGPILGFILALFLIGFILNYWFKILPPATQPAQFVSFSDAFEGEFPIDVRADIEWIESKKKWYENHVIVGVLGGFTFLYFVFVSAAYRQLSTLSQNDQIKFVIFLVALPTLLFGISASLLSKGFANGYFFASDSRKSLFITLSFVYIINLYLWTLASAIANFTWRYVPLFVVFTILFFANPIRNPSRDIAIGMAKSGRYATFKRLEYEKELFSELYPNLIKLNSDNVKIGTKIMASKFGMIDEWQVMKEIGEEDLEKSDKIGNALALGILKSKASEGTLLKLLETPDTDVKAATFWALGKVGTPRALSRMAHILEENPVKNLVSIAENAILRIDPAYPLAGLRDSIVID